MSKKVTNYKPDNNNQIPVNMDILGSIAESNNRIIISEFNSKMGVIPSFNTLPGNLEYITMDGAIILGTCNCFCEKCYGMKSNYVFDGTFRNEAINTVLIRENMENVFSQIDAYCKLNRPRAFRIHANGDILNFDEFANWVKIAIDNPLTVFYCYTKQYDWIDAIFSFFDVPKNFIINISVFSGHGDAVAKSIFSAHKNNCNIFVIGPDFVDVFDGLKVNGRCMAYQKMIKKNGQPGKVVKVKDENDPDKYSCLRCGQCWRIAGRVISGLTH